MRRVRWSFHRLLCLALPWSGRVLPETASTNDWLRDLGRTRDAAHIVVFAEKQTAGRGRRENTWDAAPGQDLTFSLALRPDLPLPRWTRATQAAALAPQPAPARNVLAAGLDDEGAPCSPSPTAPAPPSTAPSRCGQRNEL